MSLPHSPGSSPEDRASDVVRHVALSDDTVAGIALLAESLGLRCFTIDLVACHDKSGLLERIAKTMSFPDWFGHNWDALFDCLTDLGWHAPSDGYVLIVRRTLRMRQTMPEALDTSLAILEDAAKVWAGRGVTFRAFVDADGDA